MRKKVYFMGGFLPNRRRLKIFVSDVLCILLGYLIATLLVFEKTSLYAIILNKVPIYGVLVLVMYMIAFAVFKTEDILWSYANMKNFATLVTACAFGAVATFLAENVINIFIPEEINVTLRMNVLSFITITDLLLLNRIITKAEAERKNKRTVKKKLPGILIVGAGSAAEICIKEISSRGTQTIVGLVDDNVDKLGCYLCGVRVLGTRNDINRICKEHPVDEILIAIPSLEHNALVDLASLCEATGIKTKIIPKDGVFGGQLGGNITRKAREIQIEDMLYREQVELENEKIGAYIEKRKVIVTGGGGSIGSEICRQVIKYKPSQLVILDNYENNAYELLLELKEKNTGTDISVVIATVRDKVAIDEIFNRLRPDIVFHAAAHKHVPLMENVPKEAVKNNIVGTYNVAKASIKYGVKRFIMISTDKAVNPTNIMGASKRVCEMMVQTFNDKERTEFVAVRFGNVLGSNGSVIPIFKKQIQSGGPVKVTHKDITRFFMTIPEAASLVLQAGVYAENGEVFVLDMGKPIKIYELAEKMIRLMGYTPGVDMDIEIVGLRPGEKLYEELYMTSENMISTKHERIYIAKPVEIDKEVFYKKLLSMIENIDGLSDAQIKECVADITGTYRIEH